MVSKSSDGIGVTPFSSNLSRGKWEKPSDYLFACFGLALKMDIFVDSYWFYFDTYIITMLPHFLYMVIYLVPIVVIHSFMGQFSSSGFISAFRLSPFFKGMGYVSVFLTISMLIYYTIFAAIPLLFIINSFRPTLPWSCEGLKSWHNDSELSTVRKLFKKIEYRNNIIFWYFKTCNMTENAKTFKIDNETSFELTIFHVPSVVYFQNHFETLKDGRAPASRDYELSWHFVGLFALAWAMIAIIFHRFSETAKFGNFIRNMVIGTLVLLLVCFVRFLFLPGLYLEQMIDVRIYSNTMARGATSTFIIALQAFGAGWGSVIALSSFNKFKTNIISYSWIISFGQIFIYIMFGLVSSMLHQYFHVNADTSFSSFVQSHWLLFLSSASALSSVGWPNLWTLIYYTMLLMAALIVMSTQLFTVLQSLFDEFDELRVRKQEVIFCLIGVLAFSSFFFCTNHGIIHFSALSLDAIFSQTVLHLLLIFVVFWIYGPKSFQRDIEFMLGQPLDSWKIFLLRFVAPIILVICLIGVVSEAEHSYFPAVVLWMSIILVVLPILAIPGYGLYYLSQSPGTFRGRLRRIFQPNDWYPVEMEYRQQYQETVGNTEMTHQFFGVTED
ncbi:sodium- and chloride-dependent glycine transporter 1 isoform X1 [Drosophila biarmipes]|uniref:sodium- and chloride-dependent glycine transporter 1 isoform X1 n=1 Tax=Drosophila biarmipes TaxID=125945 RepID=UPI001CDA5CE4|nr:sodium- and chloride-dependent glycine transporter 1 isoform X1 [Drosophila biarmipes]